MVRRLQERIMRSKLLWKNSYFEKTIIHTKFLLFHFRIFVTILFSIKNEGKIEICIKLNFKTHTN